jgi:hypothetical protein
MQECWAQEPSARPTFDQVAQRLEAIQCRVAEAKSLRDEASGSSQAHACLIDLPPEQAATVLQQVARVMQQMDTPKVRALWMVNMFWLARS